MSDVVIITRISADFNVLERFFRLNIEFSITIASAV